MGRWKRVAIVGVGLIGGSIGIDLLRRKLAQEVVGIGRRPESLEVARRARAISRGVTDIAAGTRGAELIIVCTPVGRIADDIHAAAATASPGTIITDAGSTKAEIVRAVDGKLPRGVQFVGSHPLAGSEKSGPGAALADLFVSRTVIVTPTKKTDPAALARVEAFWQSLGAKIERMSPAAHDTAVAAISHLPHLASAALAAATPESLLPLAAGGWLDTTRVAAGDSALWTQIFDSNRGRVLTVLRRYEKVLGAMRRALERGDDAALDKWLARAKRIRDAVGS